MPLSQWELSIVMIYIANDLMNYYDLQHVLKKHDCGLGMGT